MSAGTGVTHSEFNPSPTEETHLLQIWFLPERRGVTPGYEQKFFTPEDKRGRLRLVASRDGREGSVSMNQDADMYAGLIDGKEEARHTLREGRKVWVHVARGQVDVNGETLEGGDGMAVEDEEIVVSRGRDAEVIVFDLAA
jgi:redox-sensitive bicupin YhaK (pirin superfamily)